MQVSGVMTDCYCSESQATPIDNRSAKTSVISNAWLSIFTKEKCYYWIFFCWLLYPLWINISLVLLYTVCLWQSTTQKGVTLECRRKTFKISHWFLAVKKWIKNVAAITNISIKQNAFWSQICCKFLHKSSKELEMTFTVGLFYKFNHWASAF